MKRIVALTCIVILVAITGCATTAGSSKAEKRQAVLNMKNDVLSDLYKIKPDVKSQLSNAPGYAVFSNANIYIFFASFSGGYGVVKNNGTDNHTYMKMGEAGLGLGLGAKDFRVVFVFHNTDTMNRFIEHGWA